VRLLSPSSPTDTLKYVFEDKLGHWVRAICGCLSNSTEMLQNTIIVFYITFSCDIDCTVLCWAGWIWDFI